MSESTAQINAMSVRYHGRIDVDTMAVKGGVAAGGGVEIAVVKCIDRTGVEGVDAIARENVDIRVVKCIDAMAVKDIDIVALMSSAAEDIRGYKKI